jgi:hypothetical protein
MANFRQITLYVFVFMLAMYSVSGQKLTIDELLASRKVFSCDVHDQGELRGYLYVYYFVNDKELKEKVGVTRSVSNMLFEVNPLYRDKEVMFEYKYYDLNLNLVNEGNFLSLLKGSFISAELMGNRIVLSKTYNLFIISFKTFHFLDAGGQEPAIEMAMVDHVFMPFDSTLESKLKKKPFREKSNQALFPFTRGNQHLLLFKNKHNDQSLDTAFCIFNDQFEKIFQYNVTPDAGKGTVSSLVYEGMTDSYLLFTKIQKTKSEKMTKRELLVFSKDSLQLQYNVLLEDQNSPHFHQLKIREFQKKLYISGAYFDFKGKTAYTREKSKGFYLMICDEDGSVIKSVRSPLSDLLNQAGIKTRRFRYEDFLPITRTPDFRPFNFIQDFQVFSPDTIFYLLAMSESKSLMDFSESVSYHSTGRSDIQDPQLYRGYKPYLVSSDLKIHTNLAKDLVIWGRYNELRFTSYDKQTKEYTAAVFRNVKDNNGGIHWKEMGFYVQRISSAEIKTSPLIPQYIENGERNIFKSKKNYVLLFEENRKVKSTEVRLEKIDFF